MIFLNSIIGRYTAMRTKAFGMLILVLILAFSLAGCGCFMQAQKGEAPPPKPPEAQKVMPPAEKKEVPVPPAAPPPPAPVAAAPMLNNIYFDFDRYNIRPGDAEILKKNLDWFKANSSTKVRIEGNCDERGTVEYNLALGQKRADAAKNYLTGLGVDGSKLDTISYGKERPVCTEHNEGCWAQNRRDAFVPLK
jgi:peptidoglycan-associated lipoprotein